MRSVAPPAVGRNHGIKAPPSSTAPHPMPLPPTSSMVFPRRPQPDALVARRSDPGRGAAADGVVEPPYSAGHGGTEDEAHVDHRPGRDPRRGRRARAGRCTSSSAHQPSASAAGLPRGTSVFAETDHTHTTDPVTYDHTPPAGGAHNPVWQNCGIYDQPIPDEHGVHSLEHGSVWITYQPSLPAPEVAQLRHLVTRQYDGSQRYLLLSPYPGLPAPIVASAWGAQLTLHSPSDPRLPAFVEHFIGGNQGGEQVPSARAGSAAPSAERVGHDRPLRRRSTTTVRRCAHADRSLSSWPWRPSPRSSPRPAPRRPRPPPRTPRG